MKWADVAAIAAADIEKPASMSPLIESTDWQTEEELPEPIPRSEWASAAACHRPVTRNSIPPPGGHGLDPQQPPPLATIQEEGATDDPNDEMPIHA